LDTGINNLRNPQRIFRRFLLLRVPSLGSKTPRSGLRGTAG
jgi:hypothetical protein